MIKNGFVRMKTDCSTVVTPWQWNTTERSPTLTWYIRLFTLMSYHSEHDTMQRWCFNVGPASTTLGQRKTTLFQRLVFAGIRWSTDATPGDLNVNITNNRRCPNVVLMLWLLLLFAGHDPNMNSVFPSWNAGGLPVKKHLYKIVVQCWINEDNGSTLCRLNAIEMFCVC